MRRPWILTTLVLAASITAALRAQHPETAPPRPLGKVLAEAGIPTSGLAADLLDTIVTDYAVEHGARLSVVASHAAGTGPAPLDVRVRDNATGQWRTASFPASAIGHGAVTQVIHAGTHFIVETWHDEARGQLLVLDESLDEVQRFGGTLITVLENGALLIRENLEQQFPARPLAVSVAWPGGGPVTSLYPAPPWSPVRQSFIDRVKRAYAGWGLRGCIAAGHHCNAEQFDAAVASEVRTDMRSSRIAWVVRFGPAEGVSSGPVDFRQYVVVTCTYPTRTLPSSCRERPFADYDGPDGNNTRVALTAALLLRP